MCLESYLIAVLLSGLPAFSGGGSSEWMGRECQGAGRMTAPKLPENGRGKFPFTPLTQRRLAQVRPACLLPARKPLSSAVISPIKVVAHPRLESRLGIGNPID